MLFLFDGRKQPIIITIKNRMQPGVVVYASTPSTPKQRQADLYEFQARIARATIEKPCLNKTKKQKVQS